MFCVFCFFSESIILIIIYIIMKKMLEKKIYILHNIKLNIGVFLQFQFLYSLSSFYFIVYHLI